MIKDLLLFGEIKQDVVGAAVEQILSNIPEGRRETAKRVLELTFPPIAGAYEGENGVSRDQQEWLRQARVCHPDLFEKYFTLVVPKDDLSQAELDRLIASTKTRDGFVSECWALRSRGLLQVAFERADAFRSDIPLDSMPALLRALSDLSDEFAEPIPGSGFISFDALTIAWRLVYFGLRREKDKAKRFEIIRNAFKDSDGILLPLDIVQIEERSKERENRGFEYLLEEKDLPALRKICLAKVRSVAKSGALRKHPRADDVLFRWGALTSVDEIRKWLAAQIGTPDGAAWALSLMMNRVSSNGKTRYYIKLSFVEKYADVDALGKQIADIDETTIPEQHKIAVQEFKRALRRKGQGKPEQDGYRRFDDDED